MTERYYTATEVAQMLGVSAQKIGLVSNREGLKTPAYGKWYHDKAKHSTKEVETFRYNQQAVDRLRDLIGA